MLDVDAPSRLNGEQLRSELATEGVAVGEDEVMLIGKTLRFVALSHDVRDVVERVIAAHTGEPTPAPDEQARGRFRDAVSKASTIADLKEALLGTETDAEPDVRPGRNRV